MAGRRQTARSTPVDSRTRRVDLGDGWLLDLQCGKDAEQRWVVTEARLHPRPTERDPANPRHRHPAFGEFAPTGGIGVALWRSVKIGELAADVTQATADDQERESRLNFLAGGARSV